MYDQIRSTLFEASYVIFYLFFIFYILYNIACYQHVIKHYVQDPNRRAHVYICSIVTYKSYKRFFLSHLCLHIVDPRVPEFAAHEFAALLSRDHCYQLIPCVWEPVQSKLLELVLQRLVRQTIVDYT